MIAVPKIVLIVLLAFVVWYAVRWFNRVPPPIARRRSSASPRPQPAVEDLLSCRVCGAYVAASARGCGRADCPRPI
jgi:hypothetical protein